MLKVGDTTDVICNLGAPGNEAPYARREAVTICAMQNNRYLCEHADGTRAWHHAENVQGSGQESRGRWSWHGGVNLHAAL